jgi:hypothetical protein
MFASWAGAGLRAGSAAFWGTLIKELTCGVGCGVRPMSAFESPAAGEALSLCSVGALLEITDGAVANFRESCEEAGDCINIALSVLDKETLLLGSLLSEVTGSFAGSRCNDSLSKGVDLSA